MYSDWKAHRYTEACILHTITQAHQPWHSSAKTATNKVPYYQLLLLNSISDEELSQTIGVICSSMGGGGPGLLRSHECTEFITPGAQMVSGCLSQVQVHVRDMYAQKQNETTQPRQTDVDDRDAAIVLFHQNDCSCPRCRGHLITWANTQVCKHANRDVHLEVHMVSIAPWQTTVVWQWASTVEVDRMVLARTSYARALPTLKQDARVTISLLQSNVRSYATKPH